MQYTMAGIILNSDPRTYSFFYFEEETIPSGNPAPSVISLCLTHIVQFLEKSLAFVTLFCGSVSAYVINASFLTN